MFSVIFPGQGSQIVGMGKEFFDKFDLVKKFFKEADDALSLPLSKIILEGPKDELDLTINTQPAIFLISYSIFNIIKEEYNIDLHKAKYFGGHSLGEYSALSCAGYLNFSDTIRLLRARGNAMQNAVPKGEGGMVAVLGSTVDIIEKILEENQKNFTVQIANDNSEGQIVLSGKIIDLDTLPLTNAIQRGFLKGITDNVNDVNAPKKIMDLGIETEEVKTQAHADFNELIQVMVTNNEGKERSISGTLFGKQQTPRIVAVDSHSVEVNTGATLIVLKNKDVPGIVGFVGQMLGEDGVNIANMSLSREQGEDGKGFAVSIFELDSVPSDKATQRIAEHDAIEKYRVISL